MTKRNKAVGCAGVFVAFVALLLFTDLGFVPRFLAYSLYYGVGQQRRLEKAIDADLHEIAEAGLALPQLLEAEQFSMSLRRDDERMPEAIAQTMCRDVLIEVDLVQIEMHGGFDHFGIRLSRTDEDTNVWEVLRYWEGGDELLIMITNRTETSNQRMQEIH